MSAKNFLLRSFTCVSGKRSRPLTIIQTCTPILKEVLYERGEACNKVNCHPAVSKSPGRLPLIDETNSCRIYSVAQERYMDYHGRSYEELQY